MRGGTRRGGRFTTGYRSVHGECRSMLNSVGDKVVTSSTTVYGLESRLTSVRGRVCTSSTAPRASGGTMGLTESELLKDCRSRAASRRVQTVIPLRLRVLWGRVCVSGMGGEKRIVDTSRHLSVSTECGEMAQTVGSRF